MDHPMAVDADARTDVEPIDPLETDLEPAR